MNISLYFNSGERSQRLINLIINWDFIADSFRKPPNRFRRSVWRALLHLDADSVIIPFIYRTFGRRWFNQLSTEQIDDIIKGIKSEFDFEKFPSSPFMDWVGDDRFEWHTLRTLMLCEDFLKEHIDEIIDGAAGLSSWKLYVLFHPSLPNTRQEIEKYSKTLKRFSFFFPRLKYRAAALVYAMGSLQFIRDLYATTIFRPSNDTNPVRLISFGWYSIAQDIAQAGAYGDINQVLDTRFHDLATYLISRQNQADRLEAIQNKK